MNLVLRALTLNDQALSQAIIGCFDGKGGTIGRSDTNTMTLPDPERHISRLQAEVLMEAGQFRVRNAASANAIFVNGRALGPGERGVLANRDELRIGGYVLGVQIDADNEAVRTITRGRAAIDARTVIAHSAAEQRTDPRQMAQRQRDPFADLLGSPAPAASTTDPFAFLNPAAPTPAPGPTAPSAPSAPNSSGAPSSAPARLPDDFDPFADIAPPTPAAGSEASAPRVGANDLLASVGAGSGTPASIDTHFGLGPAASGAADPLAAFLTPSPSDPGRPMAGSGAVSTDPFAMFGAAPAPPRGAAPAAHAAFNHTPELKAAYQPPGVAAPHAAPSPSPPSAAPAPEAMAPPIEAPRSDAAAPADALFAGLGLDRGASADPLADFLGTPASPPPGPAVDIPITTPAIRRGAPASATPASAGATPTPATTDAPPAESADALWAAFCEGAGIRIDLPQGLSLGQMRVLGMVMREAAEGTLRLMAVRATAKNELRAAVTTIRARNNNPLKFSPNAQAALEQLLRPPLRGFMTGPDAMQDAMHDLLGHSIGTMAGMRAALAGVLARFEPEELERKLVGTSLMDSVLPMNRKARLWDLYLQHFGSIRDDAQDDFHNLFGAAFVAAYEDQLDRLKPAGGDAAE